MQVENLCGGAIILYPLRMGTLERSPVRSDPEILGGTLVFRRTRVPAQALLDYSSDGYSLVEFLEFFPSVRKEDAEKFSNLAN